MKKVFFRFRAARRRLLAVGCSGLISVALLEHTALAHLIAQDKVISDVVVHHVHKRHHSTANKNNASGQGVDKKSNGSFLQNKKETIVHTASASLGTTVRRRQHREVSSQTLVPSDSFETDTSVSMENIAVPEDPSSVVAEGAPASSDANRGTSKSGVVAVAQIRNQPTEEKTFEVDSPDDFGASDAQVTSEGMHTEKLDTADVGEGVKADEGEHEAPTRIDLQVQNAQNLWRMKKERLEQERYRQQLAQYQVMKDQQEQQQLNNMQGSRSAKTGAPSESDNEKKTISRNSRIVTKSNEVPVVNMARIASKKISTVTAQDPAEIAQPMAAGSGSGAAPGSGSVPVGPQGVRPKGWDQCLKFARNMKGHGVMGVELIRTWKSTCEPAVQAGVATERYKLMCASLGGAVEPFSKQLDYDVFKLCDAVLTVFHDVLAQ